MFVELLCAAVAAVKATNLYCAAADDLMVKASLVSPHVLHLHALAQALQIDAPQQRSFPVSDSPNTVCQV